MSEISAIDLDALRALGLQNKSTAAYKSWFSSKDASTWEGVVCRDGRVVELKPPEIKGSFPEEIGALDRLEVLDCAMTGLNEIGPQIAKLRSLRVLNLHLTGVEELPAWLGELTSLETLRLSCTKVSRLPDEIGALTHLRCLDLHRCPVVALPDAICELHALEHLRLRETKITGLPEEIGKLESLSEIELHGLRLETLPDSFGKLCGLSQLDLRECGLESLPSTIGGLESLSVLDVSNNPLKVLPESIGSLPSLTRLWGNDTRLQELPESIGQLASLEALSVENTPLSQLPESLGSLTSLRTLLLAGDQLTSLPANIGSLTQLEQLDLSANQIKALPESLFTLPKLVRLDLSKNRLEQEPPGMTGNPRCEIKLTGNTYLNRRARAKSKANAAQKAKALAAILRSIKFERSFYIVAFSQGSGSAYFIDAAVCRDLRSVKEAVCEHIDREFGGDPAEIEYAYSNVVLENQPTVGVVNTKGRIRIRICNLSSAVEFVSPAGENLREVFGSDDPLDWDSDDDGESPLDLQGGWEKVTFAVNEKQLERILPKLNAPVLQAGERIENVAVDLVEKLVELDLFPADHSYTWETILEHCETFALGPIASGNFQ